MPGDGTNTPAIAQTPAMKVSRAEIVAVLAAGTFAGAQLMIGVSFGAQWRAASGAALAARFATDWINIATTIVPFALLQTLALPLALYSAWQNAPARTLWIVALAGWLINCTITSAYHFPVVWAAMHERYLAADMHDVVAEWVAVHWVRIALGYAVFLSALLAMLRRQTPPPAN